MGNYIDSKKESLKSKIIGRRIYENDNRYFSKLLSQCSNETLVESENFQYFEEGQVYVINHYLLPSGIHIYTIPLKNIAYISGQEIPLEQIKHQKELWDTQTITGSYAEIQGAFDGDKKIVFVTTHSDEPMFTNSFTLSKNGIGGFMKKDEISDTDESACHFITSPTFSSQYKNLSLDDCYQARRNFRKIFSEVDPSEFVDYSDEDILVMLLDEEKQSAQSKADTYVERLNSIYHDKQRLLEENETLKDKIRAIRKFISTLSPEIAEKILRELESNGPTGPEDPNDPADTF